MDLLYFNVLASGRMASAEARAQSLVSTGGDIEVATLAFAHIAPPAY